MWEQARSHHTKMDTADRCSHTRKDRGHSIPWISFPPRQTGWEGPLAPAQCWSPPGEPLSHRQTLDLEVCCAVRLGTLEGRPRSRGPGGKGCPGCCWQQTEMSGGGLSILTDASAHLSSPWAWSSSALGVHSTSNMEQPLGNRVGFRRRRQRQRGRR